MQNTFFRNFFFLHFQVWLSFPFVKFKRKWSTLFLARFFQDPVRLDANVEGGHNSIRQFTKIQIGEDVDQIDYVNTTSGRVQPIAEETNEASKFEIILRNEHFLVICEISYF